jgi:hypothetical protein
MKTPSRRNWAKGGFCGLWLDQIFSLEITPSHDDNVSLTFITSASQKLSAAGIHRLQTAITE